MSFDNAVLDALGDPISAWTFDPANSLTDKVGNNDLTNVGTIDAVGKRNRCRSFDGVDDYLDADVAADDVDVAQGGISIWYRMANGAIWSDNSLHWMFSIFLDANNSLRITKSGANFIACRFEGNNAVKNRSFNVAGRSDTDWHNILLAWDTAGPAPFSVFEDGVSPVAPTTGLTDWTGAPTLFKIGSNQIGGANRWAGSLDEITLWGGVVPDLVEAEAMWNAGDGVFWNGAEPGDGTTMRMARILSRNRMPRTLGRRV